MSSDITPPPLPTRQLRPLQYAHFEATANGFHTAGLDRKRMEKARKKAQDWINQNPSIEIITIDSSFGNMLAIVTVWYR